MLRVHQLAYGLMHTHLEKDNYKAPPYCLPALVHSWMATPIDLLMVKFTFYKRSNNLIVHLF
ncbi:hypothetical protein E4T25_09855, partial [Photobacterium damselae subsp. piscicida]|uniref:hypothetical protein n=1 Tax=Photobacterium damselae TaxID=38293 RepID=UPI0010767ACA